MFSGIVEEFATVVAIEKEQENVHFTLTCSFVDELKIDQSVAHNGVCLTVVKIFGGKYVVTAMKETLDRSNLGLLKVGDKVNVERSMMMNGRLDGHIVQGHVDQTAECVAKIDQQGSYTFRFRYAFDREMAKKGYMTVDKGSVTVNGVSLTVCNSQDDSFEVNIIPYTYDNTNFHDIEVEDLTKHKMDSEQMIIGKECCDLVNSTKAAGHRVCVVGTSVAKATETAMGTDRLLKEYEGWTNKFIFPPYEFGIGDTMLANFYHPLSTLLMETCAFGGYDLVMEAYDKAVENGYKFGCYGDAMLILND